MKKWRILRLMVKYTMNYYQLLGINKDATRDEIVRAYRKEIFKNHPDRNIGKENEKSSISILLNEAYEVLTNDIKKQEYDKKLINIESKIESTTQEPASQGRQAAGVCTLRNESKIDKIKERLKYLNYMRNRIKEHIIKFKTVYYSNLVLNKPYDILISKDIIPIIKEQTGIELTGRFIDIDIQTSRDYRWPLYFPINIYKREYCIILNTFDSKLFYILLIDKKNYDLLFKDRKTYSAEIYFDGENIKYLNNILDEYIKCIVKYN